MVRASVQRGTINLSTRLRINCQQKREQIHKPFIPHLFGRLATSAILPFLFQLY